MLKSLENLFELARSRKSNPIKDSYTNKLLSDKSLSKEKVLEEINELIEAVENNSNKIHEAADVLYHLTIISKDLFHLIKAKAACPSSERTSLILSAIPARLFLR